MFTDHPGTLPEPKAKTRGLIAMTAETFARIAPHKNNADMTLLWMFYANTARWQECSNVKAVTSFAARGLKWTEARVRKAKKDLIGLGLIEDVNRKEKGLSTGWFVKVNFLPTYDSSQGGSAGDKCSSVGISNAHKGRKHKTPSESVNRVSSLIQSKEEKLKAIEAPKNVPSEYDVEEFLEFEGLECIQEYRSDIYERLKSRKWHSWNRKWSRWYPIRDWKVYLLRFNETLSDAKCRRGKDRSNG